MEEKFLTDIVLLLRDAQWLYDFPVTQVFTRDVLTYMPEEWSSTFESITLDALNKVPECISQMDWPVSLKDFLQQCKKLSLDQWILSSHHEFAIDKTQDVKLPNCFSKGMSAKKRHEVVSLVHLVKQLSEITKCCHVLDIGSGMGYVDSLLHHSLKLTVMGAESEDIRVKSAHARQLGLTGFCKGIQHINWVLQDDHTTVNKAKEVIDEFTNCEVSCTCDTNHQGPQSENFTEKHQFVEQNFNEKYAQLIQSESVNKKENIKYDSLNAKSVMLLGLHSCADLSPVMMKMFQNCSKISSLVLLSCCYHKMEQSKTSEKLDRNDIIHTDEFEHSEDSCQMLKGETSMDNNKEIPELPSTSVVEKIHKGSCENDEKSFTNFPMSKALKGIMKNNNFHLSVFGLRLAAQESGVRWLQHTEEDHKSHTKNVAYRALLEVFCQKEGLLLRKRRRRCARKSKFCDFSEYVKTVIENYEFVPSKHEMQNSCENNLKNITEEICEATENVPSNSSVEKEKVPTCFKSSESLGVFTEEKNPLSHEHIADGLYQCYTRYEQIFSLIEPLTGLQLALQPILEALVLIDRVVYLKECQFNKVWLEKVFNVGISPRNVALIAVR